MTVETLEARNRHFTPPEAQEVKISDLSDFMQGDACVFDLTNPSIMTPEDLGILSKFDSGEDVKITGVFNIGSNDDPRAAAIVNMHNPETNIRRVFVGGLETDPDGNLKLNDSWIELDSSKSGVVIGRSGDTSDETIGSKQLWPASDNFDDLISRQHITIQQDGNSVRLTDHSTNGTYIAGATEMKYASTEDDFGHMASHTIRAEEIARSRGLLTRENKVAKEIFAGREVINRDTVDPEGMVDIRSWVGGGEAIVVDSKKAPEEYVKLLVKCLEKLDKVYTEKDMIKAIYETVSESMKYDLKFVNDFSDTLESDHKKVNLEVYLGEGKGVCRHMALATQWLGARMLEKHKNLAMFKDANFTSPVNQRNSDNAAHEWVRYTNSQGKVYIIDPAQQYYGTLEDLARDQSKGVKRWEYFKDSDEKNKYIQQNLGELVVKKSIRDRFKRS